VVIRVRVKRTNGKIRFIKILKKSTGPPKPYPLVSQLFT